MSLDERVAALERSVRRWRLVGMAGLLLAVGASAAVGVSWAGRGKVRQLTVVDDAGRERIVLDGSTLELRAAEGGARLRLTSDAREAGLELLGVPQTPRMHLKLTEVGDVEQVFSDDFGNRRVVIYAAGTGAAGTRHMDTVGRVRIEHTTTDGPDAVTIWRDARARDRMVAFTSSRGLANFEHRDPKGNVRLHDGTNEAGQAARQLHDEAGTVRIRSLSDPDQTAQTFWFDTAGRPLIQATSAAGGGGGLLLRNQGDQVRLMMGIDKQGVPGMKMWDGQGVERFQIGCDDMTVLTLLDPGAVPRLVLQTNADAGAINVCDSNGKTRFAVFAGGDDNGAEMQLWSPQEKVRIMARTGDSGQASFRMKDDNQIDRFSMTVWQDNAQTFELADALGNARMAMIVDKDNISSMNVYDTMGVLRSGMYTLPDGQAGLRLFDRQGNTRMDAITTLQRDARLALIGSDNVGRVILGADASGHAYVRHLDGLGNERLVDGTFNDGAGGSVYLDAEGQLRISVQTEAGGGSAVKFWDAAGGEVGTPLP